MSAFRVNTPFDAFQREYKRDQILTDDDLACWPDDDRDSKLAALAAVGKIEPVGVGEVPGLYPATIGGAEAPVEEPAPAVPAPQPE